MSVIPMNQSEGTNLSSSRMVWVLNRDSHPYSARFRGTPITIPANLEKIMKRAEDGGNLLPYLEAVRFVRDLIEPQGYEMDSQGKPQPIFRSKMLFEQELTADEFMKLTGKKPQVTAKDVLKEEKKARSKLTEALMKNANPNKVQVDPDEEA
jgi:hypothetical protein